LILNRRMFFRLSKPSSNFAGVLICIGHGQND